MAAEIILIAGIAAVLVLPVAFAIRGSRFDPFEPTVVFALAWGVMFVSRPLGMLVRDDLVFFGTDISGTLATALLLGLLGAVSFAVGYAVPVGPALAGRLPGGASEASRATSLAALAAGLCGTAVFLVFLVSNGGVETVGTFLGGRSAELDALLEDAPLVLWWLSLLVVPAALAAFAVAISRPDRVTVLVALTTAALALGRTVPTGSRIHLLTLVGAPLVFLYLHARRRPRPVTLVLALAAALLLSQLFVVLRYSENRESAARVLETLRAAPVEALNPLYRGPDSEMLPALAGALTVIPDELGYRFGGAALLDLAVRPVPRALWSGKPLPHNQRLTRELWPDGVRYGFDPAYTPLMSFFWDLGLLGVAVGLLVYGLVARAGYEILVRHPASLTAQMGYAAAFWTVVVAVRYDPVLLVMQVSIVFLPLIAIMWAGDPARRRRPSARAA